MRVLPTALCGRHHVPTVRRTPNCGHFPISSWIIAPRPHPFPTELTVKPLKWKGFGDLFQDSREVVPGEMPLSAESGAEVGLGNCEKPSRNNHGGPGGGIWLIRP